MSTQRPLQPLHDHRYGLRRQLLVNLGLVVFVVWGLLSLVLTRAAYLRFMQDRVRYILALSEQIDQIAIWKYGKVSSRGGPQLWFQSDDSHRSARHRPSRGILLRPKGEYHVLFGPKRRVSDKLLKRLRTWQQSGRTFQLKQSKQDDQVVWERFRQLKSREGLVGTLWLSWDLTAARGDFFSYQGILFFSLLLFGFLVLFLSMSFLERRLIKPLSRLGEAMTSLSEGRPGESLRQEVKRRDELGDLARAFVEMEQILQEQTDEREDHIAALAQTNDALARAQAELVQREKMATVGRLAAGVAHEVGNPLSAIMGYSDLLKGTKEWGEMEQDLVLRIRKETERIDRIIRDLLDYARPTTRMEPGSPHKAIREALELLRLQPRFKQMTVTQELPDALPQVSLADQYLVQVLINLLLNAADACDEKGHVHLQASLKPTPVPHPSASPDIDAPTQQPDENPNASDAPSDDASAHASDAHIELVIWDDGPGIQDDLKDRLFEPFVTTKAPGKGVGLGLALCHRWISDSGGRIRAEESPEGGALFRIQLPVFKHQPPAL